MSLPKCKITQAFKTAYAYMYVNPQIKQVSNSAKCFENLTVHGKYLIVSRNKENIPTCIGTSTTKTSIF